MRRAALGLLVIAVLCACSPTGGAPEPSQTPVGTTPDALSSGADWILVGPGPDPAAFDVTLRFGTGQLSGKAPVNTYSAPFTASEDGALGIGPITRTEMGAQDPEQMQAEERYFALLDRVDGFDAIGEELVLRAGDESLLRYAAPDSAGAFGRTLVGMTVPRARAAAKDEGYEFRVISVDGERRAVTLDYRPDRLNAAVVDGRVAEVTVG